MFLLLFIFVSSLQTELPMLGADAFDAGEFEIPFEFIIEPIAGERLVESYHGVYVNVQYTVSVELKRSGMFARPLTADVELLVHTPVRHCPGATSDQLPAAAVLLSRAARLCAACDPVNTFECRSPRVRSPSRRTLRSFPSRSGTCGQTECLRFPRFVSRVD